MDLTDRIRGKLKKERLMFVYRGDISEKNSLSLLTLLENEMTDEAYGLVGRKRLFMFVLESLQNVSKHADQDHYSGMSVVIYAKTDDGYRITTGNILENENVISLKERLDKINSLETDEVKAYYREVLSKTEFSSKGGAGLGLIEMAAKTGARFDYDFVPVDDRYSYFILSKRVDSTGMGITEGAAVKPFSSKAVIQLKRMMVEQKVNMIWSGHITSGIGEEVLSITEKDLTDDDVKADMKRRTFSVMVEILENVTKYSPGRDAGENFGMPVAMIRRDENDFVLTTGNLVYTSKVGDLQDKLDTVNRYERKGLKELFVRSLSKQTIDTDSTGMMGLISVAWKSGSKLQYRFERVNEQFSYYTLTVAIKGENASLIN